MKILFQKHQQKHDEEKGTGRLFRAAAARVLGTTCARSGLAGANAPW
jgi:hypothetical protein